MQEPLTKFTIALFLAFTLGAALAHAYYQPTVNDLARLAEQVEAERQSLVVGGWRLDEGTKQLSYKEK